MSIKISELPVGVPPAGTEIAPFVQAGVTVALTAQQIANLAPSVTAIRTKLTATTTYFVTVTGSDVTGDGSAGNPWLTLQHAMDIISNTLDFGGHQVIVMIGAGSFAGIGVKALVGGGNLLFQGVSSALTTITAGPNDGFYNQGNCIDYIAAANPTVISVDKVRLQNDVAHLLFNISTPSVFCFGDFLSFTGADVIFGQCKKAIGVYGPAEIFTAPGAYSIDPGANCENFLHVYYQGQVQLDGVFTIVGTPNYTGAFVTVSADASVLCFNVPGPVQFVNAAAATGEKYLILNNGMLQVDGTATSLPGSPGTGTIDNMGVIIGSVGTHPNFSFCASDSFNLIPRKLSTSQVPSPVPAADGMIMHIDDSNVNTYGAIIDLAGGGPYHVIARCDGTNWIVMGGATIAPNVNETVALFNHEALGGL